MRSEIFSSFSCHNITYFGTFWTFPSQSSVKVKKVQVLPVPAMKNQLILKLDTRCRCAVNFTPWSLYLPERPPVPTEGHRAGLNVKGREKSFAPTGNRIPEVPARSIVTTSAALTRLLIVKGITCVTYLANTLSFSLTFLENNCLGRILWSLQQNVLDIIISS